MSGGSLSMLMSLGHALMYYTLLILFSAFKCVFSNDLNNECNNKWHGLLTLIPDEKHPTIGCNITAVLDSSHLSMYKGNEEVGKIELIDIKAPIHVVPNSNECLVIHHNNKNNMLCSTNEYSRDAWWTALSQQVLCQRLGRMRNEIAGETSLEERNELEAEGVVENKEQKGVNIHIDDNVENLPKIAIHYKYNEGEGKDEQEEVDNEELKEKESYGDDDEEEMYPE